MKTEKIISFSSGVFLGIIIAFLLFLILENTVYSNENKDIYGFAKNAEKYINDSMAEGGSLKNKYSVDAARGTGRALRFFLVFNYYKMLREDNLIELRENMEHFLSHQIKDGEIEKRKDAISKDVLMEVEQMLRENNMGFRGVHFQE